MGVFLADNKVPPYPSCWGLLSSDKLSNILWATIVGEQPISINHSHLILLTGHQQRILDFFLHSSITLLLSDFSLNFSLSSLSYSCHCCSLRLSTSTICTSLTASSMVLGCFSLTFLLTLVYHSLELPQRLQRPFFPSTSPPCQHKPS